MTPLEALKVFIEDKLYIPTLQFFAMGTAVYFAVYIYFAIN